MANVIIRTTVTDEATVGTRDEGGVRKVYVKFKGGNGYGIPWKKADEIARELRMLLEREDGIVLDMIEFAMPDRVYLLPRPLAAWLRDRMIAKARECEEQESAEQIALDQATLFRAGIPIGLSDDPKIVAESVKLAQHDRDLRRFIPGGIHSTEIFGTPSIVNHPPKAKEPS